VGFPEARTILYWLSPCGSAPPEPSHLLWERHLSARADRKFSRNSNILARLTDFATKCNKGTNGGRTCARVWRKVLAVNVVGRTRHDPVRSVEGDERQRRGDQAPTVAWPEARKVIDLDMLTIGATDANSLKEQKNLLFLAGALTPGRCRTILPSMCVTALTLHRLAGAASSCIGARKKTDEGPDGSMIFLSARVNPGCAVTKPMLRSCDRALLRHVWRRRPCGLRRPPTEV
jgi:hypothetical protein